MSLVSLIRLTFIHRTPNATKIVGRLAPTAALGLLSLFVAGELGGQGQPADLTPVLAQEADATPSLTATALPPTATAEGSDGPTSTPLPPPTETPTPTNTPVPAEWDHLEPNNSLDTAVALPVNHTAKGLTLHNVGREPDTDFFVIYGKKGQIIIVSTFVTVGTDTRMALYEPDGKLLAENDDRSPTDLSSSIGWHVADDRWYIIKVESSVPGQTGAYDLSVMLGAPTPTATPAPPEPAATPSPAPVQADNQEPNNHLAQAKDIVGSTPYELTLPKADVDVFRFRVTEGTYYRCDVDPHAVDTVLYIKDEEGAAIAENNDRSASDIGSGVAWTAGYTGVAHVQVQALIGEGTYNLLCRGVEPTPRPAANGGPNTTAPQPTITPTPSATPVRLAVRFVSQITPATATPQAVTTVRLRVAYDTDGNEQGNPDEGVANISARAVAGGQVKNWALTDEWGETVLVIRGNVDRVLIPLLGWHRSVSPGEETSATVVIPPVNLPVVIPVAAPESK